jgi:pyridoxal phosphate-dependent aminotransferase EpsN
VGGSVSAGIFADGLCLPSGSSLTDGELDRVVEAVDATPRRSRRPTP